MKESIEELENNYNINLKKIKNNYFADKCRKKGKKKQYY